MKLKIALGALLLVAVSIAVLTLNQPSVSSKKVHRIAVNLPLTGPISSWSGEYPNGLTMGIDDACAEFGIDRSVFEIDVQDNGGNPTTALSVFERHKLSGFDAYISGTSDMSKAIANEIDELPSPHLLACFDAFITEKNPNRLRLMPNYKVEGPKYAQYAVKRKAKRVFSVILNNPAMEEQFATFVDPELKKAGIQSTREVFDWGFTEYRLLAKKAKEFGADLVLINGFAVQILPMIQALREQNLVGDGNVLCVMDFIDLLYTDTPRDQLSGVAFIAPEYELPSEGRVKSEWRTRYKLRFGKEPHYVPAFAYDTGYLFVLAHKNRGEIGKSAIVEQLPFQGIAGTISVDLEGDFNAKLGFVIVEPSGQLRIEGNTIEPAGVAR